MTRVPGERAGRGVDADDVVVSCDEVTTDAVVDLVLAAFGVGRTRPPVDPSPIVAVACRAGG